MRVLHVGWGFTPWRPGGLITYAEDLMTAQVARGDEVAYFFCGRHYPGVSGPRLKRWRRGGVAMHEVVNGPIVSGLELGTRHPERELSEPWIEAAFGRVLHDFRPDVIHIQELLNLPSALIDVAAEHGVPTVMTLQDYFPLCATLRLLDSDASLCTRLEVGEDCVLRNSEAPRDAGLLVGDTIRYEIATWRRRLRVPEWVDFRAVNPLVARFYGWALPKGRPAVPDAAIQESPPPTRELAAAFQLRRDVNVERLGRVDRLIAQSPRVAEVYEERGVSPRRLTTLPFTLDHIGRLRPRSVSAPPSPITFITLQGCASLAKGYEVVAGALRELRDAGLEGSFRLRVLGFVHQAVRAELEGYAGVEVEGMYAQEQLDDLLDDADVGIVPSIWEEALGYTGPEMIAKGIPLIANPLGGIVEYAREGETAWLNHSCSGAGLAELMGALIAEPERVLEMHHRLLAVRDDILVSLDEHVDAIGSVYRELADAASA